MAECPFHFATHDDRALATLTQAATRGDSLNDTMLKMYTPDSKGMVQNQAILSIKLRGAGFGSPGRATGSGTSSRSSTRPITPGSYDIFIAPAILAPGHVLELADPLRGTSATIH